MHDIHVVGERLQRHSELPILLPRIFVVVAGRALLMVKLNHVIVACFVGLPGLRIRGSLSFLLQIGRLADSFELLADLSLCFWKR